MFERQAFVHKRVHFVIERWPDVVIAIQNRADVKIVLCDRFFQSPQCRKKCSTLLGSQDDTTDFQ